MINRPSRYTGRIDSGINIRFAGLRTPRIEPISDMAVFRARASSLDYPFLIRNNFGHGGASPMLHISNPHDLQNETLDRFDSPIYVEWIDVQEPKTKLFRKFRVLAVGDTVIPYHLQISKNRITRGNERITDIWAEQDELSFIRTPIEKDDVFRDAANNFGLEFLAFDYGIDHNGDIVVWEANPFPTVWFSSPKKKRLFRAEAIHRTLAATIRLYLTAASINVPEEINDIISFEKSVYEPAMKNLKGVY